MSNRDSIKVVCRIRPENAIEMGGSYKKCLQHTDKDITISVSYQENLTRPCYSQCEPTSQVSDMKGIHKFTFDAVFGSEAT
jgi:hypothetical protein